MAARLRAFLKNLTSIPASTQAASLESATAGAVEPKTFKVLLVIFNPIVPSAGRRKLSEAFSWNDADKLVERFAADLEKASYGFCNYQIVERIEVDTSPTKVDGFTYTPDAFASVWRAGRGFHEPDWADYDRLVADFRMIERTNEGQIDEVWLFAFPYGGFYESRMVGPGAFWCNAPPINGHRSAARRFVIMGFNYERGVGEMLESYGHRAESIMAHVFRHERGDANLWKRFTRYDKSHPGRAEVGSVHYAPNSTRDYDWGNPRKVLSRCDNWYNFPDLSGPAREVSCSEWGSGDTRLHHLWWFKHFPHAAGVSRGISHNWWEYVADPNRVR